jgi:hypothetical protein
MAKQLKLRRGTTSQHSSFTGAEGEVTVDTTKDTVVVHDGSTAGGIPLAKESAAYTHPNHSGEVTSSADGAQTIADNVVDEANLKVSNSPTNGQFLSAQSGNTGGLTWATPTTYTHPNHSGEVTSSADGAQTIANDVVDEANLKVSNAPTNGYFLSAQSGNTGGLTWAEVSQVLTEDGSDNLIAGDIAGNRISGGSANIILGDEAGRAITSGSTSIVLGKQALGSDGASTTGGHNIALGYRSLYVCTSGNNNVAVGNSAGESVTTGENNIAIGEKPLLRCTTGKENIALGNRAAEYLTTGDDNIILGDYSSQQLTTGDNNVCIGRDTGGNTLTTGSNNICIGNDATVSLAGTSNEITLGNSSITKFRIPGINFELADNNGTPTNGHVLTMASGGATWAAVSAGPSTGEAYVKMRTHSGVSNSGHNTFAGYQAGNALTTGAYQNTLFGFGAGKSLADDSYCTLIGHEAGVNCTGDSNTILGSYIDGITTGTSNVFIGTGTAGSCTTAYQNTCIGDHAAYNLTTGSYNLLLGAYAGFSASPSGAVTTGTGIVCLGSNSITALYCADTSISSSDKRDKTDITDFTHGLKWVEQLKPVTYRWDKRCWYSDDLSITPDGSKKRARQHIGFLAQDVLAVEQADGYASKKDDMLVINLNEDDTAYGIKYERLVPVLVNAIKELSAKVKALEAK